MKQKVLLVTALVVALTFLAPQHSVGAGAASQRAATSVAEASARTATTAVSANAKKKPRFRVQSGVTLTSPLNRTHAAIYNKLLRIINHTPKGSKIRLMSWNFDSRRYVGALTAAHKRGVSVRLLMSRQLFNAQGPGRPAKNLARNLDFGNKKRAPKMKSWLRTCSNSCRGRGGAMHSKMYMFSRSGKTKHIVVNTSANLTAASANVQWNDAYTIVDNKKIFKEYGKVFGEATLDRPAPYRTFRDGKVYGFFFPLGRNKFPAMSMLNRVKCKGAKGAGTANGRTIIRVAQDVFNNKIGRRLALKLRGLHRAGCDVKVVYSQAVRDIRPIIKSMPNNHLVQDRDGDGTYDRYLHAKILSISGHYGDNRGQRIVMNGSANWSGTAIQSDEQGMIIDRDRIEKIYGTWVSQIFRIHLVSAPPDPEATARLAARHGGKVNPYAEMEG